MNNKTLLLTSISVVAIIIVFFIDPIPQNIAYHSFADQHKILGIPNYWNVISNLPFFIVGLYGFSILKSKKKEYTTSELLIYYILFTGFISTFLGSSYYHWNPNNTTLVWDRIPMTFIFMSFFTIICANLIHPSWFKLGIKILVPTGILSVLYWHITELYGAGDLRFYALIQFLPLILIPIILWLYREKVKSFKWLVLVLIAYLTAKLLETYDHECFHQSNLTVSGHSLKHVFAALACFFMVTEIQNN